MLWFLGCASAGQAQPEERPPVLFSVFSLRPITGLGFVPGPGTAWQPLVFHPTARSPGYEYRGGMPLVLCERNGTPAATAEIPADIGRALLIITPAGAAGGQPGGYRVQILDDSTVRHAALGLAVLNLSGLPLTGAIAGRPVLVQPGLNRPIPLNETAAIELFTIWKGRRLRSYTDNVTLGSNERALLILFPPFYAGSLEVQGRLLIDEQLEPAPSRPPARHGK